MTEKLKAFLIFNDEEKLDEALRFYRVCEELRAAIRACVMKINVGGHQLIMLPCLRWPHQMSMNEPSFPARWRVLSCALFTHTHSGKVICDYRGNCVVSEEDMRCALSTVLPYVEKFYDGMLGIGARRIESEKVIEFTDLQETDPYIWLAAKVQGVPIENISPGDRERARKAFLELRDFLAQKA
jgi:hypothetical protein